MVIIGILLVLALLFLVLRSGWSRLSPVRRADLRQNLMDNVVTFLALATILLLPALLLLPLPPGLASWLVLTAGLALWGFFLAAYWNERAVPAKLLVPMRKPYQPVVPPRPAGPLPGAGEALSDGDVDKAFRWVFTPHESSAAEGVPQEMALALQVSSERYEAARAEARRPVGDWAHYAEQDMPELHALQAAFARLHQNRDWSTLDQASNVLCFTQQCVEYRLDKDSTPEAEWPRYPIETLMDEEGDCEDDVILTAAVLKRLGFDVALLYYPGHCALSVAGARGLPGAYVSHDGKLYFYGEVTADGWRFGEVPRSYRGQLPEALELVQRAIAR